MSGNMNSAALFILVLFLALVQAQVDPLPSNCGQRIKPKIMGGEFAVPGEYPWQVYISTGCGATIIHPEWLLTAAHCVPTNLSGTPIQEGISACVGTIDINNCRKTIQSAKSILHYGFGFDIDGLPVHDIALVKLSEELEFDMDNTRPVCLPLNGSGGPEIGSDIEIAGWGLTENGFTHILKKAHMTVHSPSTCIDNPSLHIICLKTNNSTSTGSACFGDSGGYAGIEDEYTHKSVQYGITSFGPGNCQEPDSYTDVAYYSEWIREQINEN